MARGKLSFDEKTNIKKKVRMEEIRLIIFHMEKISLTNLYSRTAPLSLKSTETNRLVENECNVP